MKSIHLEIVSVEKSIFSGEVHAVFLSLTLGEAGIYHGHAPLLSPLKPGQVKVKLSNDIYNSFYVSGGILEVQPSCVTILADTVVRAENIDEAAAIEAQKNARKKLASSQNKMDYSSALTELSAAAAQLKIIKDSKRL